MSAVTRDLIGETLKFSVRNRKGGVDHIEGKVKRFSERGEFVMIGHNWYGLEAVQVRKHAGHDQSQGSTESRPTGGDEELRPDGPALGYPTDAGQDESPGSTSLYCADSEASISPTDAGQDQSQGSTESRPTGTSRAAGAAHRLPGRILQAEAEGPSRESTS